MGRRRDVEEEGGRGGGGGKERGEGEKGRVRGGARKPSQQ